MRRKTIDEELDDWARAKGYKSHRDMAAHLETGNTRFAVGKRRQFLQELEPFAQCAATSAVNAHVDGTGLPEIPDWIRSVARMIRVLLLGYTAEECTFLSDRMLGRKLDAQDARDVVEEPYESRSRGDHGAPRPKIPPVR